MEMRGIEIAKRLGKYKGRKRKEEQLKNNSEYKIYNKIISSNTFDEDILFTTKLLDNGVSFDYESKNKLSKNIIIYEENLGHNRLNVVVNNYFFSSNFRYWLKYV